MGLIKLSSIYRKNKKESIPSLVPETVNAPSLELNLNLDEKIKLPLSSHNQKQLSSRAAEGGLFNDIIAELKSTPSLETQEKDTIRSDFSLALALSEQLTLEEKNATNKIVGVTNPNKTENNSSFLFGTDSIYSSYLKNISAFDEDHSSNMFDSLLDNSSSQNKQKTSTISAIAAQPIINKAVLDSDISDSDEESVRSEESITYHRKRTRGGKKSESTTKKGPQPIMERRGPHLAAQRKAEGDHMKQDANESVIQRMQDRHRNQAKLTALQRRQQEQEYQNTMYHMTNPLPPPIIIPQPPNYGFPTMVLPPQGGMMMEPNPMYYSHDYYQQFPPGLLPNSKHVSHKPIRMVRSMSTPVSQRTSHKPNSPLESIQESSDEDSKKKKATMRPSRSTPNLKKTKKSNNNKKSHSLRHMKSEPDMEKNPGKRTQLLNTEWEKMQHYHGQ